MGALNSKLLRAALLSSTIPADAAKEDLDDTSSKSSVGLQTCLGLCFLFVASHMSKILSESMDRVHGFGFDRHAKMNCSLGLQG